MSDESTTREKRKLGNIYKIKVDQQTGKISQLKWKGGDEYEAVEFDYAGHITGFIVDSYIYKNEKKYKIDVKIQNKTGTDVSVLQIGFNHLAKSLINYLFDVIPGEHIALSFYTKEGFAHVFVTVGGEKGAWSLTPAQVKKMNEYGDTKWLDMANKLAEKYIGFKIEQPEPSEQTKDPESNIPEILKEDDDLPF